MRRSRFVITLASITFWVTLSGCRTLINSEIETLSERYFVDYEIYRTGLFAASYKIAHLYFTDADGRNRIIGSLNGRFGYNLSLSPDGSRVLFFHERMASTLFHLRIRFLRSGLYAYSPEDGHKLILRPGEIGRLYNPDKLPFLGSAKQSGYTVLPAGVLKFSYPFEEDPYQMRLAVTVGGEILPMACIGGNDLHKAAFIGDDSIAADLLDTGTDPGAPSWFGLTALDIAIAQNHLSIARGILEENTVRNPFSDFTFLIAAAYGRVDILKMLLDAGCPFSPDPRGHYPVEHAMAPTYSLDPMSDFFQEFPPETWREYGSDERLRTFEWFLSNSPDTHLVMKLNPLLYTAVRITDELEIVNLLLQFGADPNWSDDSVPSVGKESVLEMNARLKEEEIDRLERMKTWSPNDALLDIEGVTARIAFRSEVEGLLEDRQTADR